MPGRGSIVTLRRAAWAGLAIVLLLCMALPSSGQEPLPAHSVNVLEASVSLSQVPPLIGVTEHFTECPEQAGVRGPGDINVDALLRNITFDDSRAESQCGEARLRLSVPRGATAIVINFTADRRISQIDPQANADFTMVQEFHLYDDQGALNSADYYDALEGPSGAQSFELRYALLPDTPAITIGWYFDDQGATMVEGLPPVAPGQSFDASITNLTVHWPSVPLALPAVQVGAEEEHPEDLVAVAPITVNMTILPAMIDDGNRSAIRLVVGAGPELQRVVGPKGPLLPAEIESASAAQRQEFRIAEDIVVAQGHGTYSFEFLSARAIEPVPPPSPPSRVYPFFWTMLLLPIPAALLATNSANAYRREAEGPYIRTARIVLALIIAIVVYYVIIAYFALFAIGPRTMAVLPPTEAVVLVYSQLLVVLILLVGIAILQARARTGAMRRDIEERRRKEDRLRRSNEELERFAYVASHDLQEPLRKVAGFTALLQKRYGGRLDKDADEIIQYAVDGASRMQMLIKDILAYSRVGSKELNRVPVDANEVMEQVVADLSEPIKQNRAEVKWQDLPTVRADASQLRQVLQNLVENAIKYRHPKRRPRVDVFATSDAKTWHFAVRDNGQGIPADKLDEIFGIFRRLHGQSTPGTGIGLAVAKKAVERHDGRIWVESSAGKGSTFHFTLPRSLLDGSGPAVSALSGTTAQQPAPTTEGSSAGASV